MKRDISDMLDTYVDEGIRLDTITPLSSSRIKELTMSKIQKTQTHKRHISGRILIVAAIVAALSATVAAANYLGVGELFRSFFAKNDNTITSGQIEVMDRIGHSFEAGVISNGTIMTPVAALADENVYYLRLQIKAPESTILPDLEETSGSYQLSGPATEDRMTLEAEKNAYKHFGYETTLQWLPDNNLSDNMKEVVVIFTAQPESDMKFNDNVPKVLSIRGLWLQTPDKGYTQMLNGEFTFDIGTNYKSETMTLDCNGATYYDEIDGYTNLLENLELSPLSCSYQFKSTVPEDSWLSPSVGRIQIVMKDGTVFWDSGENTDPAPYEVSLLESPTVEYESYSLFDTPLDLSQVDYIKYGDTILSTEVQ